MRTRHIAPLLFARRVTARRPRELEMVAIVRGTFDLVQGGPMTFAEYKAAMRVYTMRCACSASICASL